MSKFEIYSLILCLVVFVLLVAVFSYLLYIIVKQGLAQIKAGLEDESILKEYNSNSTQNKSKLTVIIEKIFNVLICLVLGVVFLFSLYINCTQSVCFEGVATYRVVMTSSMETKNKDNKYLFTNDINDQISAFDLIAIYKMPAEEDLQLYDIVVYDIDGVMVVHRIVGIEEPNDKHPNERHFLLQGDAVGSPDRFPVRYSQMKGIYRGEKIPFVGSFVLFLQSPAGWLCLLLVVASMFGVPVIEKKFLNARKERYSLLLPPVVEEIPEVETPIVESAPICTPAMEDTAIATSIEETDTLDEVQGDPWFASLRPTKTFIEKLALSSDQMRERYYTIVDTLRRIQGIRVIEGKSRHSYKCSSHPIARLIFKGKTLHVCLALNPSDYVDSKYIYTDLSDKKDYKCYPMRVKLSSDRQARWTSELILEIAKSKGLVILDKPQSIIPTTPSLDTLKVRGVKKTFWEKLKLSPLARERFDAIKDCIESIENIRAIEGKYGITYKLKNKSVAKFVVKGKTLNVYLALAPTEYRDTKYIYTDVSDVAKYANYPMRVKLSSDRQVRWTRELILETAKSKGLVILDKPQSIIPKKSPLDTLKVRAVKKTFWEKLKLSPLARERFDAIKDFIESIENIRTIEGKYGITYKLKGKSVAKFVVKGKTLNVYLALAPMEYRDTKYIYTDVSDVAKYANYPMRVKVSSDRQVRWTVELLQEILK